MRMKILIISALTFLIRTLADDRVDLPYGLKVEPVKDYLKTGDQSWRRPLLAYFSIPYARPPVGDLRFRSPADVENSNNAVLWNQDFGNMCLQSNTGNDHQSEDCLTLSIFKPQDSVGEKKLPVLIWTPGGSFNMGSGGGAMVPGLVANSQDDFIGVTINYRLGALGSLPSTLTKKAGILNLGLADQLMAYKWVQKHISFFGGDPSQVTIGGSSAEAHSVGAHLQHVWSDKETPPFSRAIMSSGGPTARTWANWKYPLYEEQAKQFLAKTECDRGEDEIATFDCLRSKDANLIKKASAELFSQYSSPVRWPFQPVIDGEYVKQSPDQSWRDGSFNKFPVLTGFVTDEGSIFVPHDLKEGKEFKDHFAVLMPLANSSALKTIEDLYPDPTVYPESVFANSPDSVQFKRLSAAFTDYAYSMAVKQTAISLTNYDVPVWKYHFDFAKDAGPNGVSHGAESSFLYKASDKDVGKVMNEYYSSFIVLGDPNASQKSGRPYWSKYDLANPQQMTFTNKAEMKPDNIRAQQIDYWMSIAEVVPR